MVVRLLLIALACWPLAAGAETVYVQNDRARLVSQPGFRAGLVTPLSKGAPLQVLSKRKFWYRVESGRDRGWVFAYQVSRRPPLQKVAAALPAPSINRSQLRRRASVVTTVGAVRGLSASDRARVNAGERSDYLALEKIDSLAFSDEEVLAFLREQVRP